MWGATVAGVAGWGDVFVFFPRGGGAGPGWEAEVVALRVREGDVVAGILGAEEWGEGEGDVEGEEGAEQEVGVEGC